EMAAATACFVLENDPFVIQLCRRARLTSAVIGALAHETENGLQRLFESLTDSFKVCYFLDRGLLHPHPEQLVRFPFQMQTDCAGTCADLVFLLAAACRASGYRPIVIILGDALGHRHTLLGLWRGPDRDHKVLLAPDDLRCAVNNHDVLLIEGTAL